VASLGKGWAASWLARSGSVAPQQVLSSILIRSEFQAAERKKNPFAVLAERLGPHGHGPEFGGFLYPGKPVWLPLNEKTVGCFFPPGRVFFFRLLSPVGCFGRRFLGSLL